MQRRQHYPHRFRRQQLHLEYRGLGQQHHGQSNEQHSLYGHGHQQPWLHGQRHGHCHRHASLACHRQHGQCHKHHHLDSHLRRLGLVRRLLARYRQRCLLEHIAQSNCCRQPYHQRNRHGHLHQQPHRACREHDLLCKSLCHHCSRHGLRHGKDIHHRLHPRTGH